MSKLGVGRAIALTTLLGIVGLLMSRPELAIGQTTPPVLSDKSPELVEAERLVQQAEQLYHRGNYRDAIPLLQRVLAIRKKVLGEQHLGSPA